MNTNVYIYIYIHIYNDFFNSYQYFNKLISLIGTTS